MKKLLLVIAIPIVVVLLGIVGLTIFVNPNQFKPMITEQVQAQTGLNLEINGDISWQFFPSVGFELGETNLKNPQGFNNPNLFSVQQVGVSIAVMPLLDKTLEIGSINLDGAQVYLETLPNGASNLDALTASKDSSAEATTTDDTTQPQQQTASSADGWSISLSGVTVSNALLDISDAKTGSHTKLYDVGLTVSEFAAEQWTTAQFEVKGQMEAKGQPNAQSFTANGTADFTLSQDFSRYALKNIAFDATFDDGVNKIDNAQLKLNTFEFDQSNNIDFTVQGVVADMTLNATGGTAFEIDKAMTMLKLNALTLDATVEGDALPQSPMKIGMASNLTFDLNKSFLDFVLQKLTVNKIKLDGKATVQLADIPKVRFSLHSPDIDLDEFLGLNQASETAQSDTQESAGSSNDGAVSKEVEPDLSALKGLDVKGSISIDKFKAANARMQEVKSDFYVKGGIAELTSFSSNLYQGSITAKAKLDARQSPASYSAIKTIKGVKVQPLLIDVANNDKLEGTGNIDVNVTGKSLTPTGIKKNLKGTVKINFADGAVNGINVAQMIRENYARFKGQSLDGKSEPQKTDFSAMTATLTFNKGVVSTNNMKAESPLLRIKGSGSANYINETADFLVSTSVVGTLEGQGGESITELRDVTIPIKITGPWAAPKFALVFDDVLKQKAQKEVERATERLGIKDEKTKKAVDGLLKGLFN
ncbi:cell envelope biogenesis protein AsmA [Vibrio sp. 10N.286.49.C2]|uniref:AsmA family protein n=1 Tax=unclassified Vibrio TaxID=2614977 RepID=UPI000C8516AB|nr:MULTISPECIES: AsmA family protein [unclassified Vibrio]PMH39620.1 cell envelope biogenesis protein AsmA [Vibrio sp. 10N.286.49.C2]PMH57761.1 cell envelope biogenesis protein AsmA [Vibrio sp. 10N.286.49.B1]PMH81414.1 cell envelope biogenesis protein AsmA [Vibrio sp. 10N.286.48.B7]